MNLSNWDQVRFTTWGGASGKKNSRITPMRTYKLTGEADKTGSLCFYGR